MFAIPSLADLTNRARQAFRAYLPGSDAWLWPNNINPAAKVLGGMVHEVFGFADFIQRQKFAVTADGESLDLHGAEFGIARKPAQPAYGVVTITATEATSVDAGAIFARLDNVQYRALAAASIGSAGAFNVNVVAEENGAAGNAEAGTSLAIVSGLTGDGALAAVGSAGILGGADVEPDGPYFTSDLATYRGRILFRKRNPIHGGAAADYVTWGTSQPGVTRVYVERRFAGAGTVRVFVLMDDLYANGIPLTGDVDRVADYIATVAPAGATVTVAAPTAHAIDITVTGLTPDTPAVREAVLAELRDAFLRHSIVAGGDTPIGGMPYLAIPQSFSRSWAWQAVANASGEERHAITAPSADVVLSAGEIATLGNVTFA